MKEKYSLFVTCGYIAVVALMVSILAVPIAWRLGIFVVAALVISSFLSAIRGSVAGSHHDPADHH